MIHESLLRTNRVKVHHLRMFSFLVMEKLPEHITLSNLSLDKDKAQEVNCKLFLSRSGAEEQQLSLEPERRMRSGIET